MRSLYKIIHTTCRSGWEESEKRILDESIWMEQQGHQVVIIAPKDSPLFNRAREYGISVYGISFKRFSLANEYSQLKQIFANEQPYVVNSHGRTDARIALKAAKKMEVACRIISRHTGVKARNTWRNRTLYKQLSHYTFTSSSHTMDLLKQVFKLKDMEIFSIPVGIVQPETLMPKPEARQELAKALDLDPATRFIGVLGNTIKNENLDLLQVFKQIRTDIPHHLVIQGPETAALANEAEKLYIRDRIHFMDPQEDIWPFYRALDCGILTPALCNGSPLEGVPLTLLEAMYSSCPVISTKTGGVTDLIEHGGTGLLFDPKNSEKLPKLILQILNKEAATKEMTHAARNRVKEHHTIDAMGRNIIRIYRLHQVRLERQYRPN